MARGLILEGVTGAGKSVLFKALQRRLVEAFEANTKVFMSEHYTERILEHHKERGALSERMVLEHLNDVLSPLEMLDTKKAGSKFAGRAGNTDVIALAERFLLGHVANMRMANRTSWQLRGTLLESATTLVERVRANGLRVAVMRVPDAEIGRRVLSTRVWRNRAWADYLATIGSDGDVEAYYREWQDHLLNTASALSDLDPIYLDIAGLEQPRDYEALAEELMHRHLAPRS